jgi:uncharacterized lipoprotein YmbA
MIQAKHSRTALAALAGVFVTGCFSSFSSAPAPAERYYRIEPAMAATQVVSGPSIVLETVETHGVYVERSILHRSSAPGSALEQYAHVSWAEPPDAMLADVLVADLRSAFGADRARQASLRAQADVRLSVRVRRFEQVLDGGTAQAAFGATYTAMDAKGNLLFVLEFDQQRAAAGPSPMEFVAALDALIADADRALIERLRGLAPAATSSR